MDKQDNREVLIDIKRAYENRDYERVVMYSRDLVFAKVRENSILEMISDSYDALGRADIARDVLLTAYERTPMGRKMAFKLSELSVKLNDLDNAVEFYEDFCRMAPHDSDRYILKYEIGRTGGVPAKDLIKVLENYCAKEMDDRWMYELASLYHDQNEGDKCAAVCDDIILYFNDGEYVKKALELKNAHKALTPAQQERYEAMMHNYMGDAPVSFEDPRQKKEQDEVTDLADLFLANMKLEERTSAAADAVQPAPDLMRQQIDAQMQQPAPTLRTPQEGPHRPQLSPHMQQIGEQGAAAAAFATASVLKPQLQEERFDGMIPNHPAVREESRRPVTPVADPAFVQQAYDEPEYIQPEVLKEQFFGEKKEMPKGSIWDKPINFDNPAEPEKASFVDYRIESPILDEMTAPKAVPDEAFTTWKQPVENKIRPELNAEDAELFEPVPKAPEPTHGSFYQEVVEKKPAYPEMKSQVPTPPRQPVSDMEVGGEVDYFEKRTPSKLASIAGLSAMAGLVVKPALKGAAQANGMSFQKPVKTYDADPSEEIEIVSKRKIEVGPDDQYGKLKAAAAAASATAVAASAAAVAADAVTPDMTIEDAVAAAAAMENSETEEESNFIEDGDRPTKATFGMPKFVSVVEKQNKSEDIYKAHLEPSATVVLPQFDEDMDNVEGQITLTSMFDTYSLHMEEVTNPISRRTPMPEEEKAEAEAEEIAVAAAAPVMENKAGVSAAIGAATAAIAAVLGGKKDHEEDLAEEDPVREEGEDLVPPSDPVPEETPEELPKEETYEEYEDPGYNDEYEEPYDEIYDSVEEARREEPQTVEEPVTFEEPEAPAEVLEETPAEVLQPEAPQDFADPMLSEAEKAILAFDAEQSRDDFLNGNDPFDYDSLENAFDDFLAGNISSDQLASLEDFAKTKVMSDEILDRLRTITPTVLEEDGKMKMVQPRELEESPYLSSGGFDFSGEEDLQDEPAPWEKPPVNGLEPADVDLPTEELPYDPDYMLSDKLKRELAEFLLIEGMENEIGRVISTIAKRKQTGDLSGGNLIVTGDPKSGKTYLTIAIIKAIGREIGTGNSKVAKVQADSLNGKNMDKVLTKIKGSDLIIENVGYLNDDTIRDLIETLYTTRTDSMIVLEGNQLAVECILNNFPEINDLFRTRLTISELTLSQWADLACNYAEEMGYHVDDMALLALHRKIDEINVPTSRLGFNDIRGIIDKAISKAEKRNSGRFFRASKKSKSGIKELDETDF